MERLPGLGAVGQLGLGLPLGDDYDTMFLRLLDLYDYQFVKNVDGGSHFEGTLDEAALARQRGELLLPSTGPLLSGPFPDRSRLIIGDELKLPVEVSFAIGDDEPMERYEYGPFTLVSCPRMRPGQ